HTLPLPLQNLCTHTLTYIHTHTHTNVAQCTGTRKVPRYPYVKNYTILHIFGTGTSLKKHAIRAHSLFRSLSARIDCKGRGCPALTHANTSGTKQTPKGNPSTHTDPSNPLRQREGTCRIWLSTYQTDTPNFSESSKNDRLANVIINMNTHKVTHIQPNTR